MPTATIHGYTLHFGIAILGFKHKGLARADRKFKAPRSAVLIRGIALV